MRLAFFARSFLVAFALSLAPTLAWAQEGDRLTVLTHSSFDVSQEVIARFTEETGVAVSFVEGGDAGETVNRAILTRGAPLADLLFGVDNNLIARALEADLFEPYVSPALERVPERYRFEEGVVTPVTVGFVNFNLDRAWFEAQGLEAPRDILELTEERYRGLSVVTNPASSSPGLAFMLATIDRFGLAGEGMAGEGDWLEFWAALRDNGLLVTSGWSEAYYTAFTRYGGDRPIVLSYATSPAAEVYFADEDPEEDLDEAPTENLFCEACVYRQIEGVGILRGTQNREAAEAFIDFMLSDAFQEDIPLRMFVYPASERAALPEVFTRFAEEPSEDAIARLPAAEIEANLESWLDLWTAVVQQGRDPAELR